MIRIIALAGCWSWCGGFVSANSIIVTPSDQMSTVFEYHSGFCSHLITSGAIQQGLPMKESHFPLGAYALTPKSAILMLPEHSKSGRTVHGNPKPANVRDEHRTAGMSQAPCRNAEGKRTLAREQDIGSVEIAVDDVLGVEELKGRDTLRRSY